MASVAGLGGNGARDLLTFIFTSSPSGPVAVTRGVCGITPGFADSSATTETRWLHCYVPRKGLSMKTLRPPSDRPQCWAQALRERARELVMQRQRVRQISGTLLCELEVRRNGKQKDRGGPPGFPTIVGSPLDADARASAPAPLCVPDHVASSAEMNELPIARRDVHLQLPLQEVSATSCAETSVAQMSDNDGGHRRVGADHHEASSEQLAGDCWTPFASDAVAAQKRDRARWVSLNSSSVALLSIVRSVRKDECLFRAASSRRPG